MSRIDQVREDLDYVASAVRRDDRDDGVPRIYYLWAVLIAIGFALPDLAPRWAGLYWFTVGPAGGLASWWLGARYGARSGIRDVALGRRYGYHWLLFGVVGVLVFVPVLTGRTDPATAATNILLVAGFGYALAGVHLERPLLWSGLVMLAGYLALVVVQLPYVWTATGIVVALSLALAGITRPRPPAMA